MDCSEGELYIQHTPFKITLLSQILVSLAAVIVNGWFWTTQSSKIYFHSNLRSIILLSIWLNITHSVIFIIPQTVHLMLYGLATNPCSVFVPFWFCSVFRGVATCLQMAYTPIFVAMIIERAVATVFLGYYERSKSRMLYYYLAIILSSLFCVYLAFRKFVWQGDMPYCSAISRDTADDVSLMGYLLTGMEAAAILGLVLVFILNKRLDKRNIDIKLKYQVRENLAALKLLVPLSVLHWLSFTFFYAASVLLNFFGDWEGNFMNLRTAYTLVYIVPLYCLISPYLLICIAAKQKHIRGEHLKKLSATPISNDAYEKYLRDQWEN